MPRKKTDKAPREVGTNTATAVAELPAEPTASAKRRKKSPVEPAALSTEPGVAPKKPRRKKQVVEPAVAEAELVGFESVPITVVPAITNEPALEPVVTQADRSVTPIEPVPAPSEPVAAPAEPVSSSINAESPPFDAVPTSTTHTDRHHASLRPMPDIDADRPRFRSWSIRTDQGYEKFTDSKRGLLVLKFAKRPAGEILDTLKVSGFRYAAEYEDQGKCWLRKNDYEGRLQVEKIEMLLRETGEQRGIE